MNDFIKLIGAHPYLFSACGTFFLNNIATALISSLPAPTKDSTRNYIYWFKVANTIIGNLQRAKSTAIEQSPNFQDAVATHIAKMERPER